MESTFERSIDSTVRDPILGGTPDAVGSANTHRAMPTYRWSAPMGIAAIVVGITVLVGWFLDVGVLRSVLPSWPSMKPNTAVSFALLGLALWATDRLRWRRLRTGLIVLGVGIALATLVEYAFRMNLHIDEVIHDDVRHSVGTAVPGRMAFTTAVAFLIVSAALVLTGRETRRSVTMSQTLATCALGMALISLAGYLYAVPQVYGLTDALMGIHTCLVFVLLSLGVLSLRPKIGLMATVTAHDAGGQLARRLLPAAILAPLALAWIRWQGEHAGLFGTQLGLAIFAVSNIAVFAVLVFVTARSLSRTDEARRSATERLLATRNRVEDERKELEGRLHQSERLESVGQLAGGIAHDFNNLLGVIMNYAAFVIEQTEHLPEVRADAVEIQSAAERAARLTRQLLIFARRDAIKREPVDLNLVVADMENLLSRSLGEHIDLVIRSEHDLPTIRADKGQVEQVLVNLVVNARDAMPAGGTLTVETATTELDAGYARMHPGIEPGRHATLTVSDTGTGMSTDVAARIFEPFFTTKPKGEGTGLGLATVYGIVREAGGDVSVSSAEGIGSTFRVDLRALDASPAPALHAVPARPNQGHGETVLVVEDEPAMLELTSRILQRNGYVVLTASTYEQAIGLATDHDFQLLLADSIMPNVPGHEVTDQILELRPDRAVLYMSGYSDGALGTADDGVRLLPKPFTQQQLLAEVRRALAPEDPSP